MFHFLLCRSFISELFVCIRSYASYLLCRLGFCFLFSPSVCVFSVHHSAAVSKREYRIIPINTFRRWRVYRFMFMHGSRYTETHRATAFVMWHLNSELMHIVQDNCKDFKMYTMKKCKKNTHTVKRRMRDRRRESWTVKREKKARGRQADFVNVTIGCQILICEVCSKQKAFLMCCIKKIQLQPSLSLFLSYFHWSFGRALNERESVVKNT